MPKQKQPKPPRQPFLLSRKAAAFELGISEATLAKLVRNGEIAEILIGRRSLFVREELARFAFARLERRHRKFIGLPPIPDDGEVAKPAAEIIIPDVDDDRNKERVN